MQTRGTFPALNDGMKKPRRGSGHYCRPDKGVTSFAIKGKLRKPADNPKSLSGRRDEAHRKAHGR